MSNPRSLFFQLEATPSITILNVGDLYSYLIRFLSFGGIPIHSCALCNPSCETLSKAFSQSSNITLRFIPDLLLVSMILRTMCVACVVLFFFSEAVLCSL